ncbi:hypothetical protein A3D77_02900 [Candidatus Gottesmanbacteria bacterium RIFCSPHIGHO2_02_FULL_39_11]|uniref:DUF1189 domain-containing protein n=1 Tax=Candidatus Gottesmanbacteria bacterium RIFCSPHIGHO2_02_FULL_39_11 TaxID=1798382 RepID=A0A1F5ZW16_9BACT|nr:MAG: hypothetical protein A3D77_02900 [Candidatus Gottesmanbacteria bacterium RIFCSPHIGHO2_02_FULL_39_11]
MSKLKTFFRSLYLSATNPSYYRDLLKTKFSFSLKYFFGLSLLLTLISTIVFSLILIPQIKTLEQTLKTQADTFYPNDLVITLKNGKLSTNRKDPIVVTFPFDTGENRKNLVIDPTASISAMEKYQAGVLINEDSLSLIGENNQIRTYPLSDIENFTLNKSEFSKGVAMVEKFLDALPAFLPGILLVIFVFSISIGLFLKILFYSLLTYAVARVQNLHITYGKAFQLTIHAITPIVLLQILEIVFGIQIPIPLFFQILYVILLVIIIKEIKNKLGEAKK